MEKLVKCLSGIYDPNIEIENVLSFDIILTEAEL